MITIIYNSIFR